MGATELWAAVVASYPEDDLVSLTNIRDRSATTIGTAAGENAAQGVIDLWPVFAQTDYDDTNAAHVEVGKRACIAMLWSRGGTAASIAKVEWDEVFGDDGLIGRVRKTGPRGRQGPASNSGVQSADEGRYGPIRGWADRDALPGGILPNQQSARNY